MSTRHHSLQRHPTGRLRGSAYTTLTATTTIPTRLNSLQRHPHRMPTRLSLHGIYNNDSDVYAATWPTATPARDVYAAQPTRHQQQRQRCLRGLPAYSDIHTGCLRGSAYTTPTTTTTMSTRPPSLQRHPHRVPTRLSLRDIYNGDNDVYAASQPTATSAQDIYAAQPTRHLRKEYVYAALQPTATPDLASTRLSLHDVHTFQME